MKKVLISILFVLWMTTLAIAGEKRVEQRIIIDIPFRLDGSKVSDIRHDLGIDSVTLKSSLYDIQLLNNDPTADIKSIEFYSSVSPEGSYSYNDNLSELRLRTAERIIRKYLHYDSSVKITYSKRFIPWQEYLIPAIEADSTVPYRKELLQLMSNSDRKFRRANLKSMLNGKLWNIVKERYFDLIRKGGAIITVDRIIYEDLALPLQGQPFAVQCVEPVSADDLSIEHIQYQQPIADEPKHNYGLSVKTNAVGIGLAITNLAVEFDFAKHWSIAVPVYYSAHNYFKPTVKFRTLATQPEVRYWLKENNMGFFAGAHFGVASYNIAVDGIIRYQDHAGVEPALGGGISIGYRVPFSKKHPNWHIEFTIGAGAYSLLYDTFYNVPNGRLIDTYKKTYWGIDNAAINISYRFDLNKRKR